MARRPRLNPLSPVHPGEVLRRDFLETLGLTAYRVAKAVGVPRTRIERLAREVTPVTADTALRLSRFFGTSARFWMSLQARYNLEVAEAAARDALAEIAPRPESVPLTPPPQHAPRRAWR